MNESAFEYLLDDEKTTLSEPGGIVLSFGKGPGIRTAIHWNRIGALFSSYRPLVAGMMVFKMDNPYEPLELRPNTHKWIPNLLHLKWKGDGFTISEDKFVTKNFINDLIVFQNDTQRELKLVSFFYGGVRQCPFFDYHENQSPPEIAVKIDTKNSKVEITQPHPFPGLPLVSSIQQVTISEPLASFGFYLDEGDLFSLIENYGCLACLRLRLGQVSARFSLDPKKPTLFQHQSPRYYFAVIVKLMPKERKEVVLRSGYKVEGLGAKFFEGDMNLSTEPRLAIAEEQRQWKKYFQLEVPSISCADPSIARFWNYVWYVLKANRSAPGAHVKHSFTSPSKHFYWGVWIWDTYFHILGERWLGTCEVARDSIRAVLDTQAPNGYIPCCSGVDYRMLFEGENDLRYVLPDITEYKALQEPHKASFRFRHELQGRRREVGTSQELTQTPLIACAVFDYALLQNDWEFAKEVFPSLLAYEEWIWRRRTDEKGRFVGWHGIESGWDDATRHYPPPFKAVDMTVHAYRHRRDLALMAEKLGKKQLAEELWSRARLTAQGVQSFWNKDKGCFLDKDGKNKVRPQISASTFFPLWARLADAEQAGRLLKLLKSREFGTKFPVPTLATSEPDYNPHGWGWNGPVWLQVNWFIIEGLFNYGYFAEAMELWEKTKSLIIKDGKPASCELYDPELGTGIGAPDYSWQALVNDFIITRIIGLRREVTGLVIAPLLPEGTSEIGVSFLPVEGKPLSIRIGETKKETGIMIETDRPRTFLLKLWKKKTLNRLLLNGAKLETKESAVSYTTWIHIKTKSEVIAKWR